MHPSKLKGDKKESQGSHKILQKKISNLPNQKNLENVCESLKSSSKVKC